MTTQVLPITLTANEKMLVGVKTNAGQLSIGPSGGNWLTAILTVSFTATLTVPSLFVSPVVINGFELFGRAATLGRCALLAVPTYMTFQFAKALRERLICTEDGVEVRHGLFQTTFIEWQQFSSIVIQSTYSAGGVLSRSNAPDKSKYEWPVIYTTDQGSIVMAGLATSAAGEWMVIPKSGARQRMEIVQRYQEAMQPKPVPATHSARGYRTLPPPPAGPQVTASPGVR